MDSDWGIQHEETYRQYFNTTVRRKKLKLLIEDGGVYLDTDHGLWPLCKPSNPNRFWYEAWQAVKSEMPAVAPTPKHADS